MQRLLLFNSDSRPFVVDAIRHIVQSVAGFRDGCFDESCGALIQAMYYDGEDDWTLVHLSSNGETISLSGDSDAALKAALTFQQGLPTPLRIIDLDYSFDLVLSHYKGVEELRRAMQRAN